MDRPQIVCHIEKSLNYTIYDAKWIPCSAKFVTLGSHPRGTGALQIYELSHANLKLVKETEKSSSLKCGTFGASSLQQRHLATGDFAGRLMVWDLERLDVPSHTFKAHKEIINGIDGCGGLGVGAGAPEILTGSRDGCVKVWDVRQKGKPVASMEPADGEQARDCWAVAFGNAYSETERCAVAGYDNGDVKMFDLRTMSVRWETNVKNGVCCVEFDRKDINMNKLFVGTLESKFHIFDLRTQHPEKGFASLSEEAHKSTVWQGRHLPQNRDVFMSCGGNGTLNLYQYSYPAKRKEKDSNGIEYGVAGSVNLLHNVTLSTQPISTFDWCADKEGLGVCTSFDQSVRVMIVTKLNTLR